MAESVPPAQAEHVEERHARTRKALYTEIEHLRGVVDTQTERMAEARAIMMDMAALERRARAFLSGA